MEHPVKIAKLKALPVLLRASLVAQQLKNPPANAGDMGSTHSSILAWEIPWTDRPDRLYSMGLQRVGHDLAIKTTNNNLSHLLLLKTGHFR